MVIQLDVKAFDHVDRRAAFKAMKLQGVSPFSMALIAAIWNGSCKKARLGTISSSKVRMSRELPQCAPESPVIFTMIMELVLRQETGVETGRLCAGCDLLCGRCGVGRCVGCCCGGHGDRGDHETEGSWFVSWCREDTIDESQKRVTTSIVVDGLAVLWEEVLEFVGS